MRVEFKAGYYEWNIFIDGEYFYTFGDGIEEDIHGDTTYSELESIVESCMECMDIALMNDEKEAFPNELRAELKEQMMAVWAYHYGITVA